MATASTARPDTIRPQARNVGGASSRMTLMKRNDQPQMKASRNRRRTGTPQEVGEGGSLPGYPRPNTVPGGTVSAARPGRRIKSTASLTNSRRRAHHAGIVLVQ